MAKRSIFRFADEKGLKVAARYGVLMSTSFIFALLFHSVCSNQISILF